MSVFRDGATIDKHIQLLHAAGITTCAKYPHTDFFNESHNCWGLTAHLLGWTDESLPTWIDRYWMVEKLNYNSISIPRHTAKIGDIIIFGVNGIDTDNNVLFHCGALEHTALLTDTQGESDNWCYLHKPGEQLPEVGTLDGVDSWHSYCKPAYIQQFRHPI